MPQDDPLQSKITGFWSAIADGYEAHAGNVPAYGGAEYAAWADAISAALPAPPADVLDLATGTGFVALIAAGLGHRVTGVDLAEPMLAEARRHAQSRDVAARFMRGDAVDPDFPAASFDAVVSRHLIWTLRDLEGALANWRSLLRPAGRVVAFDGFWFKREHEDSAAGVFESFYTREARARLPGWRYFETGPIQTLFEQAGYARVSVTPLGAIHSASPDPPSDRPGYVVVAFRD